jgi:hypothetical protein
MTLSHNAVVEAIGVVIEIEDMYVMECIRCASYPVFRSLKPFVPIDGSSSKLNLSV